MLTSILYGFGAGILGTVIGALIPILFNVKSNKACAWLMSFAAGFMLAVVFCDLLPESIARSKVWVAILSMIGGGVFVGGLNLLVQNKQKIMLGKRLKTDAAEEENYRFRGVGLMILLAIAMHNLPEGLAIGSLEALDKGFLMAMLIGLHNIPEGIAMSAPLQRAGVKKWKIILLCAASGVPTIAGAAIGYWAGSVSNALIASCLGVAAGAMIYIVFTQMLPDSLAMERNKSVPLLTIAGVLLGVLLINVL